VLWPTSLSRSVEYTAMSANPHYCLEWSTVEQQFQIQDFDRRSSVVAQLRPLIQLSTTIKDNAKMSEIEPCAGGV
jgi:hypothetical protein